MKANYPGAYKRGKLTAKEERELQKAIVQNLAKRNPLFAAMLTCPGYAK